MKNFVSIKNIRKSFGDNVAVADVSFEVVGREVFGLLGPNGAGKTTTIRMVLDLFKPDRGSIAVLGGKLTTTRRDRIGYMPEERGLYPYMKVLDCLVYMGSLKGMARKAAKQRAIDYLERLELADQHKTKIEELSRGMTQKVQVIAAVLHQPDLLIIDEPFANLDPVNTQLVRDIILELRDQGKAIIMTSHQLGLVETLCDRIALIDKGIVVLEGTVAEVRRRFATNVIHLHGTGTLSDPINGVTHIEQRTASDWYLTVSPDLSPQAVINTILTDSEFTVNRFAISMPTLDEIFVQVVRQK
ncbi:ATP-binding cassette domain-containing protein [Anaerolineales bacterium HSG6]|nr:ATP-binding cassette domain-containing protein [Anaerolineales bacterium HSG6]MDM8529932.1 ATP-binding cassette domain-containing protein [Anaerolineales bacterium HSG25]